MTITLAPSENVKLPVSLKRYSKYSARPNEAIFEPDNDSCTGILELLLIRTVSPLFTESVTGWKPESE